VPEVLAYPASPLYRGPALTGVPQPFITQTKAIDLVGRRDEPFKRNPIMSLVIPGLHRGFVTHPATVLFHPVPDSRFAGSQDRGG
jgi:hypothetical protein